MNKIDIKEFLPSIIEWRHHIHQHPELAFDEHRTAAFVAEKLRSFGVDHIEEGVGKTGVVATIYGKSKDGPSIGLRADMDALALHELGDVSYRSKIEGKMHACGHDGHTATMLGVAKYLCQTRNFNGSVHVIFQPAEEGYAGAKAMIDDGLFERFPCQRIYGMHNMPGFPAASFNTNSSAFMAGSDRFIIKVIGRGGHAAFPELAVDPIVVASSLIMSLQTLVSRNTSALSSVVLSFTSLHAGEHTFNVLPNEVVIQGSLRTLNKEDRTKSIDKIQTLTESICHGFGAEGLFEVQDGSYPVTVNHPEAAKIAADAARDVLGDDRVDDNVKPVLGSEDFSFMLEEIPGCYFFMGNGLEGHKGGCSIHNPYYDFNDDIIEDAINVFVSIIHKEIGI